MTLVQRFAQMFGAYFVSAGGVRWTPGGAPRHSSNAPPSRDLLLRWDPGLFALLLFRRQRRHRREGHTASRPLRGGRPFLLPGTHDGLARRYDPQHHPLALYVVGVVVLAVVLPRKLVDVVPGLLSPHCLHDLAAYLGVAVGVLLVPDRQRNVGVALDVLVLLAVYLGVYDEALASVWTQINCI